MKQHLKHLQSLGRALMLPIAVLPVAALLLRMGQPDLLGLDFVSAAGNAMFANLGLLFAIGVATGFARDGNGAASLAGVVCFLIATEGAMALMSVPAEITSILPDAAKGAAAAAWRHAQIDHVAVPIGIISGIAAGLSYNRFSEMKLPEYLAFFGGRRFVPIVCGMFGLVLAGVVGACFTIIDRTVSELSSLALSSGSVGLFVFGLLNRLLLVTGLHHILNNIAWFVIGDYHGTTGDLRRFFAGDPTAGTFMSGFFPVMMFGLPAACLAMYHTALPERRKATGGMLLSLAATSFLTGVTEPIEFSFMFLAPGLFALHAVLTGLAMAFMAGIGSHLGFGFSAGLFDYILNFSKAQRPLALIPVGLGYALIYYLAFRFAISRFGLLTPGREPDGAGGESQPVGGDRGIFYLKALGGARNLREIGACTTRLRLVIEDQAIVDEAMLRRLGAKGLVRPSPTTLQVVLGPQADQVAVEIRAAASLPSATEQQPPVSALGSTHLRPIDPDRMPRSVISAFGGPDSVMDAKIIHGRILLGHRATPDAPELMRLGARGVIAVKGGWQILFEQALLDQWSTGG